MKLVISGGTGFIGSELVSQLARQNHTLTLLSRKPRAHPRGANIQWMVWDGGLPGSWQTALDGADGVINLAGEPIAAKRWSAARKQALR